LQDLNVTVELDTTFDQLCKWVSSDDRGKSVDAGNMKLCYNSFMEKAEAKEKEQEREQARKRRRHETAFRTVLRNLVPPVEPNSQWDIIRPKIENEDAFLAVESEELRRKFFNVGSPHLLCLVLGNEKGGKSGDNLRLILVTASFRLFSSRGLGYSVHAKKSGILFGMSKATICGLFQDYIQNLAEACGHHHGTGKKKKKDKKKRKKDDRDSDSDAENRPKKSKKKHHHSDGSDDEKGLVCWYSNFLASLLLALSLFDAINNAVALLLFSANAVEQNSVVVGVHPILKHSSASKRKGGESGAERCG
uniref:FF domain-containing protein n=1 Tax=Parascaris equorum TaxID=6256 RepID=A0A914S1J7_PAREQ